MSVKVEFETESSRSRPLEGLYATACLRAKAFLDGKNLYLEVSDYEQPRLTGFYTVEQIRAFAHWLIDLAAKYEVEKQ